MNGTVRRLDKVAIHLTAHERAVLVLRAWKEGRAEDRSWRAAMPDDQQYGFSRLLTLMHGINIRLLPFIVTLQSTALQKTTCGRSTTSWSGVRALLSGADARQRACYITDATHFCERRRLARDEQHVHAERMIATTCEGESLS